MSSGGNKSEQLEALLLELRSSEGWSIRQDWTDIQWTLSVLQSHLTEFAKSVAPIREAVRTGGLLSDESVIPDSEIRNAESEVVRAAQGFLTCANTLYEQAQTAKSRYICDSPDQDETYCSCDSCQEHVDKLHETEVLPRWKFVQRLRAYFQHVRTPTVIHTNVNVIESGGPSVLYVDQSGEIRLRADSSSIRNEMNKMGNQHIDSIDGDPHLLHEFSDLSASLFAYYDWYYSHLRSRNEDAIEGYEQRVAEIRKLIQHS